MNLAKVTGLPKKELTAFLLYGALKYQKII
jgi:hypothetical protein